jgi:hypothetical protein
MIAAYLPAGILMAVRDVELGRGLVIGLVRGRWVSYSYRRKRQSNEYKPQLY